MSTNQKRSAACCSARPSSTSAVRIMSATPIAAEPAPRTTMRWSVRDVPATFVAVDSAPSATAAVPWMSSLKVSSRSW